METARNDYKSGAYLGNVEPKGDPYKILQNINGTVYHKHTENAFANFYNRIRWGMAAYGLIDYNELDLQVEKKEYDSAEESFNNSHVNFTIDYVIGRGFIKTAKFIQLLRRGKGSIWNLDRFARGRAYEEALDANLRHIKNYNVIDDFVDGVGTSIKTLDVTAATYMKNNKAIYNQIKGYVDKLDKFKGVLRGGVDTRGKITKKVLEVGIPRGATQKQIEMFEKAVEYGREKGITVNIRAFQ